MIIVKFTGTGEIGVVIGTSLSEIEGETTAGELVFCDCLNRGILD